jgi:hypothetical protein
LKNKIKIKEIVMTGPGEGKLLLKNAKVFIDGEEVQAEVYIHVKGFSLARVTHLDIESNELNKVLASKQGGFFSIYGIDNGIEINFEKSKVKVLHNFLKEVLKKKRKNKNLGWRKGRWNLYWFQKATN